ncbi:hypothetical protein V1477_005698 [Vespula maculifrons]|uniref:NADH dehydrogenase subunit 6 n=1 Tax=Vespula maculifrons TaxID=7453 RepID=A0ABD2CM01_VESMC
MMFKIYSTGFMIFMVIMFITFMITMIRMITSRMSIITMSINFASLKHMIQNLHKLPKIHDFYTDGTYIKR